jgi:cytochrome c oxidase assembly factor CtaG
LTAATAPELLRLPFERWQLVLPIDFAALAVLAAYGWAALRAPRWPAARAGAFAAGVATVIIATQSGIAAYDDRLLSAHMVQHLLLLMAAPALLLAGRPLMLALRALPPERRRPVARELARARWFAGPFVALPAFAVIVLATHLRVFYEATLSHPLLHDAEHLAYLLAGLLLFAPLLDAVPGAPRRLGGIGRLAYLLAVSPPMAFLGAYLSGAAHAVYPSYSASGRALGISAVADQHHAGAIMWVAGGAVLVAIGLWSALAAMVREERNLAARERRLDAGASLGSTPAARKGEA